MKKILLALTASVSMIVSPVLAETKLKLVEVITGPERTKTLQKMVNSFESNNPGNEIEIISLPWGQAFEKLAVMVSGGDAPDVVEMPDSWIAAYAGSGQLMDLENRIKNWDDGKTLTDKTLTMARYAGHGKTAYTVPYGFYLRAMFYNKKLLAQAGVDTPPKTMKEFMEASRKVSELPGKSGYCLRGGPGSMNAWVMFAATMNGSNEFFNHF